MASSKLPSPFTNLSTALPLFLALLLASLHTTGARIGVCYGRQGNNLPPADQVIDLYSNKYFIGKIRLYEPYPEALEALQGKYTQVMLGVPNEQLESISSNQSSADTWVKNNVVAYSNVSFKYITVGNEVEPNDTRSAPFLVQAMKNIRTALDSVGFKGIAVSTAFKHGGVMGISNPPSEGRFNEQYRDLLNSILPFLKDNDSPMLLNMYPFFSYLDNPSQDRLDYAIFEGDEVPDPPLRYGNLFDALLDSVYSALGRQGMESLNIVVSETGWPTAGGGEATTVDIAETYINNLIEHVEDVTAGTPMRPDMKIDTYIYAMFDEENKEPELGKHFGLFNPNLELKYPINFNP